MLTNNPSSKMKILTAMKLLRNGGVKGCSRQAIKAQIARSYGKEIANHVFNKAMNFAMEIGVVKSGSTKSRFKLTPDAYEFLSPPKQKKTAKKSVKKRRAQKTNKKKTAKKNSTKKSKLRMTYKKIKTVTKKRKSSKKKAVKKKRGGR